MNKKVQIKIVSELDIMKAVQQVEKVTTLSGFNETNRFLIATSVSELARNIVVYAAKGKIIMNPLNQNGRTGIEIIAEDQGPGIQDIPKALEDHYSSGKGLGLGLPGVRRMMDEFTIVSSRSEGTRVTVRKWVAK